MNHFSLLGLFFLFCAVSCSGPEKIETYGVLEPLEPQVEASEPTDNPTKVDPQLPDMAPDTVYQQLESLLQSSGYRGIGLKFENEATLRQLIEVFSDEQTQGRQIKLVYTGLRMSYGPEHQSLTIGGLKDAKQIVSWITGRVPKLNEPIPRTPPEMGLSNGTSPVEPVNPSKRPVELPPGDVKSSPRSTPEPSPLTEENSDVESSGESDSNLRKDRASDF